MSFLTRLFQSRPDPREEWRALWHAVVAEARDPDWYRVCGVADTLEGRYDMVTLVLALVMIRMEDEPALAPATPRLTELFVEDMEAQLREAGIGDPTVGKKIGKLVGSMGGRLGAYRQALANDDRAVLVGVVQRNVTLAQEDEAEALAEQLCRLHRRLARASAEELRKGEVST